MDLQTLRQRLQGGVRAVVVLNSEGEVNSFFESPETSPDSAIAEIRADGYEITPVVVLDADGQIINNFFSSNNGSGTPPGIISIRRIGATTTNIELTTDITTYHIHPNGSDRNVILPGDPNEDLDGFSARVYTVRNIAASNQTAVLNIRPSYNGTILASVPTGFYVSVFYDGVEWFVY